MQSKGAPLSLRRKDRGDRGGVRSEVTKEMVEAVRQGLKYRRRMQEWIKRDRKECETEWNNKSTGVQQ